MNKDLYQANVKDLKKLIIEIDNQTHHILGNDYTIFGSISVPATGTMNEAAFIRLVSLYYVLFHEVGKPSIDFLISEFKTEILTNDYEKDIRRIIHSLRTFFHHNLDSEKIDDLKKLNDCEQWFNNLISKQYPDADHEWETPLEVIMKEGVQLLSNILVFLKQLPSLETSEIIKTLWSKKVFNNYGLYDFEKVCVTIAEFFEMDNLNSHDFCMKRLQRWRIELSQLKDGYDFHIEASKLIERDIILLITESKKLPITGTDILKALEPGVKPGKKIGLTLQQCQEYFDTNHCSKEDLLEFAIKVYNNLDKA